MNISEIEGEWRSEAKSRQVVVLQFIPNIYQVHKCGQDYVCIYDISRAFT